jgi:hypothetical protein
MALFLPVLKEIQTPQYEKGGGDKIPYLLKEEPVGRIQGEQNSIVQAPEGCQKTCDDQCHPNMIGIDGFDFNVDEPCIGYYLPLLKGPSNMDGIKEIIKPYQKKERDAYGGDVQTNGQSKDGKEEGHDLHPSFHEAHIHLASTRDKGKKESEETVVLHDYPFFLTNRGCGFC